MAVTNAGIMITGSQKALACAPGIAVMILSPEALKRVEDNKCCCQYLDLKLALKNMERGQTPWTPAVGILRQINVRLKEIEAMGGAEAEIARCADLAKYFRDKLVEYNLPFEIVSESLSNVKDTIFRVGHIGYLQKEDYDQLITAFLDLREKKYI